MDIQSNPQLHKMYILALRDIAWLQSIYTEVNLLIPEFILLNSFKYFFCFAKLSGSCFFEWVVCCMAVKRKLTTKGVWTRETGSTAGFKGLI